MAAQSLVLCHDPEVLGALRPLLDRLGFGTQMCPGAENAARMLLRHRYQAVIVECDGQASSLELLRSMRQYAANQESVAVAIVDDARSMRSALETGANFVLSKPIPLEDARRILQAAQGMMGRMVRRFLRLPVGALAYAEIEGLSDKAMLLDLSEGGISVQALETLPCGRCVSVSFEVPGTALRMRARATVAWMDASGRLGLRFEDLAEEHRASLKQWVRSSLSAGWAADAAENAESGVRPDSLRCRVLSEAMDTGIVAAGTAGFGAVFLQLPDSLPGTQWMVVFSVLLLFFFWLIYHYIFFLHCADTAGLIAARRLLERSARPEGAVVQASD